MLSNYQKLSTFDKIQLYLYDDNTNIPAAHQFSDSEIEIKKRYAAVFTFWIDKPTLSDKKIINYMISELDLSKSQAYRDLYNIKILLGNVRNATKEWQRYKLIAMLDKAYEFAEKKKDAKSMILAADKLGKYTQLDKEDAIKIPYDEIVPQNFDITPDVSVLDLVPIENLQEVQSKMRKKYGGALIEDAEIIDETKK
jgi:hypothetical protein